MKYLILVLWSLSAFSQDVITRECSEAALRFGNGEGDDYISKDCFDWVKSHKTSELFFALPEKIQVMGYRNLIFVSEFKEGKYLTHIIAGVQTGLKDIRALSVNLEKRELYVAQERELRVYSLDITGNVGPMRRWKVSELPGVDKVSFRSESDEIVLEHAGAVMAYPRLKKSN